jgi:hypothetical protein
MSGFVTTKKVKRTPKSVSSLFMKQNGNVSDLAMVPNSCIESAEYIMQCQSKGYIFTWSSTPPANSSSVLAMFGKGVTVDISKTELIAWASQHGSKLTDYPFTTLPSVGEGIILLHKKKLTGDYYHMHVVAVLACYGDPTDEITVSAMAEPKSGTVNMAALKVESITDIDEFRTKWFEGQEAEYAIGLLRISLFNVGTSPKNGTTVKI